MTPPTRSTALTFSLVAEKTCPPYIAKWAREIAAASLVTDVDPYLIAAIMARESMGGDALTPRGPGGVGDKGRAHGLMQLDIGAFGSVIKAILPASGRPLWTLPSCNVLVGALHLKHALYVFQGEEAPAVAAYNCGEGRVRSALMQLPPGTHVDVRLQCLDSLTTGKDYVTDVLRRRAQMLPPEPVI